MKSGSSYSKVDYAGRTVDLLLLKTVLDVPVARKRVGVDVSDVVGEPMIVSGVEKMVQRFALLFMTAMGSVKFAPARGTNLIPMAASGRIYDMSTLKSNAVEANMLASSQMFQADAEADASGEATPDDERLVDSEVVGLEFVRSQARVRISIRLESAAGLSYTYIIPVAVGVH